MSSTLRIGLVAPLWVQVPPITYGGIERRVAFLAGEFIRRGHAVTVFASGDSEPAGTLAAIYPTTMCEAMEAGAASQYDYYINALIAEVLARSSEFDVIHFHLGAHSIPFSRATGTPTVHTIPTAPTRDDVWVLERYPEACVTALSRQQASKFPSDARARVHVVYNGCDVASSRLAGERREHLVCLGRIGKHKGTAEAIRIARQVRRKLILAGAPKTASEHEYFSSFVEPQIDGEQVVYLGEVNNQQKNELFDDALALLFPIAWDEPFGNVMIEAMACGVPVLAIRRGSVPEVLDEGVTGFSATTPDDLIPLVPKAALLDRRRIRERVEKRFSIARMAADYLAVYNRVVNPGRAAGQEIECKGRPG